MNIKLISAFAALATFTAICASARAAVVINVVEQGIDVVANGSGSVDTADSRQVAQLLALPAFRLSLLISFSDLQGARISRLIRSRPVLLPSAQGTSFLPVHRPGVETRLAWSAELYGSR
jgi:hypothetical protein